MDRDTLRKSLQDLLERETWEKFDHIDDSVDLREGLKLDSVDMISLILEVQNQFQIEIQSRELQGIERVGQLLDLLHAKVQTRPQAKAA